MPHFPTKDIEVPHSYADREGSQRGLERPQDNRVRIKNRRQRYLDLHPEYFKESSLELAGRQHFGEWSFISSFLSIYSTDPLLYDRLIRRFQTAAERESEGRLRGYSGILEANLVRSEAKLEALDHPDPNNPLIYRRAGDGSITAVEQDESDRPSNKDEGWSKWEEIMGLRFVRGDDADFDYATVDENDEYDHRDDEDRSRLEEYLNEENEEFLGEGTPTGQTGVQDF